MSGFAIAIVIIIVVISSLASQKQKRDRQNRTTAPVQQPQPEVQQPRRQQERKPLTPSMTHVITPSFVSGHAHQETSMTGDIPCEPVHTTAVAVESKEQRTSAFLDCGEALRGIVYAEILGKPKALQRR